MLPPRPRFSALAQCSRRRQTRPCRRQLERRPWGQRGQGRPTPEEPGMEAGRWSPTHPGDLRAGEGVCGSHWASGASCCKQHCQVPDETGKGPKGEAAEIRERRSKTVGQLRASHSRMRVLGIRKVLGCLPQSGKGHAPLLPPSPSSSPATQRFSHL